MYVYLHCVSNFLHKSTYQHHGGVPPTHLIYQPYHSILLINLGVSVKNGNRNDRIWNGNDRNRKRPPTNGFRSLQRQLATISDQFTNKSFFRHVKNYFIPTRFGVLPCIERFRERAVNLSFLAATVNQAFLCCCRVVAKFLKSTVLQTCHRLADQGILSRFS